MSTRSLLTRRQKLAYEFKAEISKCRTFVFLHELEMLLEHNLIKGGALENAIVLVDKEISKEKMVEIAEKIKSNL